jgi:tetratricopeptide (TPR) repeat protein
MKKLFFMLIVAFVAQASAQKPEFRYDPNSPDALAAKAKREGYERDGRALNTYDLYKEVVRLDTIKKSRTSMATKPEEIFAEAFRYTDDDARGIEYWSLLKKRSDGGDTGASYYYAIYQWDFCLRMQQSNNEFLVKDSKECWQGVMSAFKKASDAQIASATFNIGKIYQNGLGVTPSKFVAAEWFVKSADQFNKEKSRDEALTALESALNLVPDHPGALRLRKAMLK